MVGWRSVSPHTLVLKWTSGIMQRYGTDYTWDFGDLQYNSNSFRDRVMLDRRVTRGKGGFVHDRVLLGPGVTQTKEGFLGLSILRRIKTRTFRLRRWLPSRSAKWVRRGIRGFLGKLRVREAKKREERSDRLFWGFD